MFRLESLELSHNLLDSVEEGRVIANKLGNQFSTDIFIVSYIFSIAFKVVGIIKKRLM